MLSAPSPTGRQQEGQSPSDGAGRQPWAVCRGAWGERPGMRASARSSSPPLYLHCFKTYTMILSFICCSLEITRFKNKIILCQSEKLV